jgi:hypothetical protein
MALGIEIRGAAHTDVPFRAIPMEEDARLLLDGLLPVPNLLEGLDASVRVLFSGNIDEVFAEDLLRPVTQDRFDGRIDIGEFSLDAKGIDDIRRVFAEGPEPLLALPEFLIRQGVVDADADLRGMPMSRLTSV